MRGNHLPRALAAHLVPKISTHDVPRSVSRPRKQRLKLLRLLVMTELRSKVLPSVSHGGDHNLCRSQSDRALL